MKRSGSKTLNMGVALVAAYMLVLQALFGAFAQGVAAASPFDDFGNPLCVTSGDAAERETAPGGTSALPECCLAACGMFAPAIAVDRNDHSLANPLELTAVDARPSISAIVLDLALDGSPGRPRGPPLTV